MHLLRETLFVFFFLLCSSSSLACYSSNVGGWWGCFDGLKNATSRQLVISVGSSEGDLLFEQELLQRFPMVDLMLFDGQPQARRKWAAMEDRHLYQTQGRLTFIPADVEEEDGIDALDFYRVSYSLRTLQRLIDRRIAILKVDVKHRILKDAKSLPVDQLLVRFYSPVLDQVSLFEQLAFNVSVQFFSNAMFM
jgi:hypothetical protein